MRFFISGLSSSVLVTGAYAQWYGGYPPMPGYYAPYPSQNVVVVPYPPNVRYVVPVVVQRSPVVVQRSPSMIVSEYSAPQPVTYLIAFKNDVIRSTSTYWVRNNVLYYVTLDHQQRTAVLDRVNRALTQRLNDERNVTFYLPPQPDKAELRRLLGEQLNLVLETRDTSCGLIVRISDIFFQFDDYSLTPEAREKLDKIADILVTYGGLYPHLNGYTDNVGGDTYNLQLSWRRAEAVREYLICQGLPAASLTATGLGKANPVASNRTAEGRRQNRRVEMLISGDSIGVAITSTSPK
jgi:outer membrane protein OmpA-like peptidoglycan-associated protein